MRRYLVLLIMGVSLFAAACATVEGSVTYDREQLAIAEAIRVQIEQLGFEPASYLKLLELEAWNGQLPDILFTGSDGVPILPFLDLVPEAPK